MIGRNAIRVADIEGADLAYWVARANLRDSSSERDVQRAHYGVTPHYEPMDEPSMRAFVEGKFGTTLPDRWHCQ